MRRIRSFAVMLLLATGSCAPQEAPQPGTADGPAEDHVRDARGDEAAIREGYRERLRLGLGSPFRLIDFALADPRLRPEARRAVGADLLTAVLRGRSYEIDIAVLAPANPARSDPFGRARRHLRLIEAVIEAADDPRVGEISLRLAYRLAALEETSDQRQPAAAAAVASLVRDRVLARRDAEALLRAARAAGAHPLELVPEWRRERRFQVELPAAGRFPDVEEASAVEGAARILPLLRLIELGQMTSVQPTPTADPDLARLESFRAIADSMAMPPRVPIVIALLRIDGALPVGVAPEAQRAWAEFAAQATNEERFASRYAAVERQFPTLRTSLAATVVSAAVGMRTYAQEPVWYPGFPTPTREDLREDYGLRVRTAPEVPERWVPYYLLALRESLEDLRRVVPDLGVFGLTVAIDSASRHAGALASHSALAPGSRVLEWPVTTGPGTLAHEIAHDLDWQVALRSPGERLRASNRVHELGPSSLASALEALTPAGSGEDAAEAIPGHATRPGEVLARAFEWFVVSRLAAGGIWNGALSSAQDELFTGHGSLGPPGVQPGYARAVVEIVRVMADPPAAERTAFLADYGANRWPTAGARLRAFGERLRALSPVRRGDLPSAPALLFGPLASLQQEELATLESPACPVWSPFDWEARRAAHRRLVVEATVARGRAIAFEVADWAGGAAARGWMERELLGPLWPAVELDSITAEILSPVAVGVHALEQMPVPIPETPFAFGVAPTYCSAATSELIR